MAGILANLMSRSQSSCTVAPNISATTFFWRLFRLSPHAGMWAVPHSCPAMSESARRLRIVLH